MRKIYTLLLALTLPLLTSCSSFPWDWGEDQPETVNATAEDAESFASGIVSVSNGGTLEITADLTVNVQLLMESMDRGVYLGRGENCTYNGNGHTITLRGNPGSLGDRSYGVIPFPISGCTVKDLNIVFNFDFSWNVEDHTGGIAGEAYDSTFENVTVSFPRGAEGTTESLVNVGGLVGYANDCTFTNCQVSGDITANCVNLGGLVGHAAGSTAFTKCTYEGTLYHQFDRSDGALSGGSNYQYYHHGGGLVGYLEGSMSRCYAKIKGLQSTLSTGEMHDHHNYIGGLIGGTSGYVSDCYVDIDPEAEFHFSTGNNLFGLYMNSSLYIARFEGDAYMKNVYVDMKGFLGGELSQEEDNISYGDGNFSGSRVDDAFLVVDEGFLGNEGTSSSNAASGATDDKESEDDKEYKSTITVVPSDPDYDIKRAILRLDITIDSDGNVSATPDTTFISISIAEGGETLTLKPATATIDEENRCISLTFDRHKPRLYNDLSVRFYYEGDITAPTFTRVHHDIKNNVFQSTGGVKEVTSYDQITFDFGEGYIGGGNASKDYWTRDENGKYILA